MINCALEVVCTGLCETDGSCDDSRPPPLRPGRIRRLLTRRGKSGAAEATQLKEVCLHLKIVIGNDCTGTQWSVDLFRFEPRPPTIVRHTYRPLVAES